MNLNVICLVSTTLAILAVLGLLFYMVISRSTH